MILPTGDRALGFTCFRCQEHFAAQDPEIGIFCDVAQRHLVECGVGARRARRMVDRYRTVLTVEAVIIEETVALHRQLDGE